MIFNQPSEASAGNHPPDEPLPPPSPGGEQEAIRAVIADLRVEKNKWAGTGAYAPMNSAANRLEALLASPVRGAGEITDAQIKHMVDRFLGWKLPENFSPDGGISFKATINEGTSYAHTFTPNGTNVFDARQAEAMVRHMIAGMGQ